MHDVYPPLLPHTRYSTIPCRTTTALLSAKPRCRTTTSVVLNVHHCTVHHQHPPQADAITPITQVEHNCARTPSQSKHSQSCEREQDEDTRCLTPPPTRPFSYHKYHPSPYPNKTRLTPHRPTHTPMPVHAGPATPSGGVVGNVKTHALLCPPPLCTPFHPMCILCL